ncbi:MAG: hypothetical protein ABIB61_04905 [Candidatus Shapirobacteria bacterium]
MFAQTQGNTAGTLNIGEYINRAWPAELFPKVEIDKKTYGSLPYIERPSSLDDQQKENEWLNLLGIDFYSLSEEKRNFLIKTAGIFDFGQEINIKKVYTNSIY